MEDIKRICSDSVVLNEHGILKQYQVFTKKNTPDNMGDYNPFWDVHAGAGAVSAGFSQILPVRLLLQD